MKKFYVGAKHIGAAVSRGQDSSCTRETLNETIEEAKNMIRNNEAECLIIVQIVAVVRRDVPIIVEEV
jgi:hypothetical protein